MKEVPKKEQDEVGGGMVRDPIPSPGDPTQPGSPTDPGGVPQPIYDPSGA